MACSIVKVGFIPFFVPLRFALRFFYSKMKEKRDFSLHFARLFVPLPPQERKIF